MNQKEEKALRESIRYLIRHVKQKKLNEENELRNVIRGLMDHELQALIKEASVPDVDPVPNKSTGINVLEELLKKIIPVLEVDYKSLTTNTEQRESFRAHIINAVVNTLTPARINTDAGDEEAAQDLQEIDMEEEIDVEIGDAGDDDKFIDIRTDAEKSADEDEEEELYFDKFEGELSSTVDEPTNQAYDMAKSDTGTDAPPEEGDLELDF